MPKVDKFNPGGFLKNFLSLLIAAGKITLPGIGLAPEGAGAAPVPSETPEEVGKLVDAALQEQAPPEGVAAGPITNALIERAVDSSFKLLATYQDEAVAFLIKLSDKFDGVLPFKLP